jgi:hypothetical protein
MIAHGHGQLKNEVEAATDMLYDVARIDVSL